VGKDQTCGFGITYGGGSSALYGYLGTDNVCFGGYPISLDRDVLETSTDQKEPKVLYDLLKSPIHLVLYLLFGNIFGYCLSSFTFGVTETSYPYSPFPTNAPGIIVRNITQHCNTYRALPI
jgi:hypothetical protein